MGKVAGTNAIHLSRKTAVKAFREALYQNICATLPFLR
jgi:hypothetical protein